MDRGPAAAHEQTRGNHDGRFRIRITTRRRRSGSTSLYSASTELCADTVEFHPSQPGLFALGTYQVDKQDAQHEDEEDAAVKKLEYTRRGRFTLHQIEQRSGVEDQGPSGHEDDVNVRTLQSFDTAAILDMKWHRSHLALADALGSIHLYSLTSPPPTTPQQGGSPMLQHTAQLRLNPHNVLCLSLDWRQVASSSSCGHEQAGAELIVSQSDGTLVHLPGLNLDGEDEGQRDDDDGHNVIGAQLNSEAVDEEGSSNTDEDEDELDPEDDILAPYFPPTSAPSSWTGLPHGAQVWLAHEHEAWIAAWDRTSPAPDVVWSGGDDCVLKGWDVRTAVKKGSGRKGARERVPIFSTRRGFDGGVTAIQSSHLRPHLWAVGSYDGHLRLFDARSTRTPLQTLDVGGGIWRTKWHPHDPARLLLGCMHNGFQVVHVGPEAEVEVVRRFEGHASLAYGCDWERGLLLSGPGRGRKEAGADGEVEEGEEEQRRDTYVASCSFYDARMHIWTA
ncbi:hypothetical protein V8E36_009111 [Tilletia maclaganii]